MAIDDKKLVEVYLNRINGSGNITECNKKDIVRYYNVRSSNGLAIGSNRYVLFVLWKIGEFLDKPFKQASADDLMAFFCGFKSVNGESYSPRTMWTYKAAVKTFWKWLFGINKKSRECPEAVDWIERNGKVLKTRVPKDVLTKDEINLMIKATSSPRDKAIIAVLFDTGMRCGELLNMRKNEIKFFDDYAEFEANGKTGPRQCLAVESMPYLRKYLNWLEKNKGIVKKGFEDRIWFNLNKSGWVKSYGTRLRSAVRERGTPLTRDGVNMAIKRAGEKARVKKKIWTHLMRHSSATYWAQFMNESEMRIKFGWARESTMPSVYINLDYSKVKEKQLKKAGKWQEPDTNEKQMFRIKECPFCGHENPKENEYCGKCAKPMDAQKIRETEKQSKALNGVQELITKLNSLENKGFDLQQFNRFMESWVKENAK